MLAALLLLRTWGLWVGDALVWPVALVTAGAALIWRQSGRLAARRPRCGGVAVGRSLVLGGGLVFLWLNDALEPARDAVLAIVVILVAGVAILAPFWLRLVRGLGAERAARIRSQERAEVAAHLHDSVLQTLALMQKRADDPRAVATLARRQERELRAWLNGSARAGRDAGRRAAGRRRGGRGGARHASSRSSRSATGRSTRRPRRSPPPPARR